MEGVLLLMMTIVVRVAFEMGCHLLRYVVFQLHELYFKGRLDLNAVSKLSHLH